MFHALNILPPDPLIPSLQIERGAAEADAPQPSVVRSHQIAQLSADQPAVLQRMLADHEFIPGPAFLLRAHLDQAEPSDILDRFGNRRGCFDRCQSLGVPRPRPARWVPARSTSPALRGRGGPWPWYRAGGCRWGHAGRAGHTALWPDRSASEPDRSRAVARPTAGEGLGRESAEWKAGHASRLGYATAGRMPRIFFRASAALACLFHRGLAKGDRPRAREILGRRDTVGSDRGL